MEVNGTEVGLGMGAFFTTVLAWFKLKPKPENNMDSILERIKKLEGGQRRLEDSLEQHVATSTIHVMNTREDVEEIKSDNKELMAIMVDVQKTVARMEGKYEAVFRGSSR